jgi:putative membrane protein
VKKLIGVALSAMLLSVSAWAEDAAKPAAAAGAAPAAAAEQKLNDRQIATVALVANKLDADHGKMAQSKATNPEVKKFAQQMVTDHQAGEKAVKDLAKKLKVKPQDSALSKGLKDGGAATAAKLKKLKGEAFDKAYVDSEVEYHQAVIDAINNALLPAVQNEEVKAALNGQLPLLNDHLTHAKSLQATLGEGKK